MPDQPKKRPLDTNQLAKSIVERATKEPAPDQEADAEDEPGDSERQDCHEDQSLGLSE